MAEKSGFFNATETSAGVYDRTYEAEDFANYFAMFIGNGVFMNPVNQLQVVPKTGLTVTVKAGKAFIDGYWYELDEDKDITLSANSTSVARTDLITCTLNKSSRTVISDKKENVRSTIPTNNGTTHELILAVISVGVGVSSLTAANITDTRPDSSKCGFVGALIEQPDFSVLFDQMEAQFNEWFDEMKGQLSTDAAGNLQTQIDELNQQKFSKTNILTSSSDVESVQSSGKVADALVTKQILMSQVKYIYRRGSDIPGLTNDERIYGRLGNILFVKGNDVFDGIYNGVSYSYIQFYDKGQIINMLNRCDPDFSLSPTTFSSSDLQLIAENGDGSIESRYYLPEIWSGSYDRYFIYYWPNGSGKRRVRYILLYFIPESIL